MEHLLGGKLGDCLATLSGKLRIRRGSLAIILRSKVREDPCNPSWERVTLYRNRRDCSLSDAGRCLHHGIEIGKLKTPRSVSRRRFRGSLGSLSYTMFLIDRARV